MSNTESSPALAAFEVAKAFGLNTEGRAEAAAVARAGRANATRFAKLLDADPIKAPALIEELLRLGIVPAGTTERGAA